MSQTVSRQKWLKRNGGKKYFLDSDGKDRVQRWRKKHPRYWEKESFEKRPKYRLTKRLREMIGDVALQDSIDMNLPLKIGIISHLTGTALQDVIAKEIRRLMFRGHAILCGKIPEI